MLAERRVVVLEETARTFLRDMHSLDDIRTLQHLIAATYAFTLWMLVINQQGFHFLDAAVKLGDGLSHRLALARESAGVYRTAFELWSGQIDDVQTGTMVLKPISAPAIDAVIEQMDSDDLLAREIIESEPGRPGFRVHPGAARVVREALHRRNLG